MSADVAMNMEAAAPKESSIFFENFEIRDTNCLSYDG